MAKDTIKGITVAIGGDTTGLQKALTDVNKKSSQLNSELREVERGLKLDPTNTTLLAQKQQILSEQIRNTSAKLNELKNVQAKVEERYKNGDIGADAYRAFQRELVNTENRLSGLQAEQKNLKNTTKETEKETKDYSKALEGLTDIAAKAGQAILDVAKAAGEMALNGMKAATKVGSDFESSVSQLAATMGKSTDEITTLTDKAKELGSTTQFSASQAADGLNILAMAGLNAEQQTEAIGSVLNLAAAGSLSLEQAASYTTGAVKGFGDEMENAQKYADLMAKGATLANTDVNGLGAALSGASATAKSYGQDAEGVTLSLLRLAEQNVTGEQAATMLSRAMTDLYTPTDTAKKALDELGIAAYDSNGKARDFTVITDELNKKLSGMTEEQANAYKATIFTTNGLNGFNKMMASSPEKVEAFKNGLADAAGSAENQAKTMIDNLQGDITIMQSAAEGLGITFYETFNDDLRSSVQFATDSLGKLTEAFEKNGLEGAADVAGTIISDIANKAVEYAPTLIETVTTLIDSIFNALSENSGNIAQSAGKLITLIASGLTSNTSTILNAVLDIGDNILSILPYILGNTISSASSFAKSIIDFISKGISIVAENLPRIIFVLSDGLIAELPVITQSIFDLITNTVNSVLSILPDILSEVINLAVELIMEFLPQIIDTVLEISNSIVDNLPKIIDTLATAIPDIITGVLIAVLNQIPKLLEGVFEIVSAITESLPQIIESIVGMLPEIINAIVIAITVFLPKIIETGIVLFTAIIEDLPQIINGIVEKLPEIIDSIIGALLDALPLLIDCGVDLFLALIENLPTIIMEIQECIPQIIEGIAKAAIELFPRIVTVGVQLFMSLVEKLPDVIKRLANRMPEIVTGLTDKIKDHIYKMVDIGKNLVEGIWEGIQNAKDWLIDNIFGWCSTVTDSIKNFFGIHSPSTLFRDDIGKNLAFGVGEGFGDAMDDVSKDMQKSIPTAFDIDPSVNLISGDSRMQTFNNNAPVPLKASQPVQSGGVINFTLQIDNFNNTANTSVNDLSETITTTLHELIRRNKLAVI